MWPQIFLWNTGFWNQLFSFNVNSSGILVVNLPWVVNILISESYIDNVQKHFFYLLTEGKKIVKTYTQ